MNEVSSCRFMFAGFEKKLPQVVVGLGVAAIDFKSTFEKPAGPIRLTVQFENDPEQIGKKGNFRVHVPESGCKGFCFLVMTCSREAKEPVNFIPVRIADRNRRLDPLAEQARPVRVNEPGRKS